MVPEHVTLIIFTLIVVGVPSALAGGLSLLWWRKARRLGRRPRPGPGTVVLLVIPVALGVYFVVRGLAQADPDYLVLGLAMGAAFLLLFGTGGVAGWLFASSRKAEPAGCGASRFTGMGMLLGCFPLMVLAVAIPSILPSQRSFAERDSVSALRTYQGAQAIFRGEDRYGIGRKVYANPKDGTGFPDLHELGGPDSGGRVLHELGGPDSGGEVLELVDIMFARARAGSGETRSGYVFADITADAAGPYDYARQHGLCAVPADYPRSGRLTFVTDASGRVYSRDTGGRAVTTWPDVEGEGWLLVAE